MRVASARRSVPPEGRDLAAGALVEFGLRCNSCGAPYPSVGAQEILTCTYCGTTQRMVDARQFLDHFTAQVTAYLRQTIPPGAEVGAGGTVDATARLAAFNTSVRPGLAVESDQYRFALFNLLAAPFAVLPFLAPRPPPAPVSAAAISMFVAKVQSVGPLAVDEASREMTLRATGLASAYQSLIVTADLLRGTKPERFHLAAENLTNASAAVGSLRRWAPVAGRLEALALQARAADQVAGGRPEEARPLLGSAGSKLAEAGGLLSATPEIGFMSTPVEQELALVRALGSMAAIVSDSAPVSPHPLVYLQRLGATLDGLAQALPGDWGAGYRAPFRWEEILARASEARRAQAGLGAVRSVAYGGGILVPFWEVELPYNFETGVLWTKKGREVSERLLIAATFPTDPANLAGPGVYRPLTDVFALGRGATGSGRFYDRMTGKEQKISESGSLAALLQSATPTSIAGRPAAPPLTSRHEALKLVRAYLNEVRAAHPKLAAQLRTSSPRVLDLVYVPCTVPGSPPVPGLGALSPLSVGDPQALLGLAS